MSDDQGLRGRCSDDASWLPAAATRAAAPPPPATTTVTPGSVADFRQNVGDRVFFDTDMSNIREDGRQTLNRQAEWLKKYTNYPITIEGHCDERGTREYNLALGERRANAARQYLVAQGIPAAAHQDHQLRQGASRSGRLRRGRLGAQPSRGHRVAVEAPQPRAGQGLSMTPVLATGVFVWKAGRPCLKMAAFELKLSSAMKTFRSGLPHLLLAIALALPTAAAAQRMDPVYIEDRLNQLQQAITMLTGQLEQLQYRNQQLQQQMEKMQADYEYRLEQMEKGGGGAPAARRRGPTRRPQPRRRQRPCRRRRPRPQPPARDQIYNDAFKKLQDGDYAGAERGFKAFLQGNPKHVLAGNAQYWLGETYYARRDYQNAMTAFAEGYKVYKASPKGPDNLLKLGVTLAVLGRKPDACAVFAKFNQDYPRATDLQKRRVEQERQKNGCG